VQLPTRTKSGKAIWGMSIMVDKARDCMINAAYVLSARTNETTAW